VDETTAYDVNVQNVMTNEAGHWLVLNDLYDDVASEQTMYGISSDRELKGRNLESGDIADLLGHKKLDTTRRYQNIKSVALKERLKPIFKDEDNG